MTTLKNNDTIGLQLYDIQPHDIHQNNPWLLQDTQLNSPNLKSTQHSNTQYNDTQFSDTYNNGIATFSI
jgi:hypothetical protein